MSVRREEFWKLMRKRILFRCSDEATTTLLTTLRTDINDMIAGGVAMGVYEGKKISEEVGEKLIQLHAEGKYEEMKTLVTDSLDLETLFPGLLADEQP
jgi:hypothetical protein